MADKKNINRIISNPLVQTFLVYISGGWIVLEMTEYFINNYGLTERFRDILLIIMIIGVAVIIVMAVYTTERILKRIEQLGQEKENLGHQLIRAAQLAEIGEMAAGFAHEINNPLQIIKSEQALIETLFEDVTAKIAAEKNEDINEIADSLNQIKLQVNRCSEITHAILKFGRKNEIKQQVLNPCHVIPEIVFFQSQVLFRPGKYIQRHRQGDLFIRFEFLSQNIHY